MVKIVKELCVQICLFLFIEDVIMPVVIYLGVSVVLLVVSVPSGSIVNTVPYP